MCLFDCVLIVRQHFKQFYYRQLESVSQSVKNVNKIFFTRYVN